MKLYFTVRECGHFAFVDDNNDVSDCMKQCLRKQLDQEIKEIENKIAALEEEE